LEHTLSQTAHAQMAEEKMADVSQANGTDKPVVAETEFAAIVRTPA
jgi:hypothetical protein